MAAGVACVRLTADADWDLLEATIFPECKRGPLPKLLSSLKEMGALSAVIEDEYLDRDFTAEFSAFYCKLFARYSKLCKRVHFFSVDVTDILDLPDAAELSSKLEEAGNQTYLGFIVARPVAHSRVGRTVIAAPRSPAGMASKLLVRAQYDVHLLGASLQVVGVPLVQQDTRVGACAQAAIWSAGRHFHVKHRGAWLSVSDITEEALQPVDFSASTALPAGSQHLSVNSMVIALRRMGREPFSYVNPAAIGQGGGWAINPEAAISRYVDSGIPVILGLSVPNSHIGHAVVAIGQTAKMLTAGAQLPSNPTRAVFCEAFLVNDDQRGAYLRLPVSATSGYKEVPFTIEQNLQYFLIPLPNKVYRPAESAEEIAWDILRNFYVVEMPKIRADSSFDMGSSNTSSDAFLSAVGSNHVIARTYLTYGWKHRLRILRNSLVSETVKQAIIRHDLPRYVWITEFGTLDSMNHLDPGAKRIFSHTVIDATSSQFDRSALFFHAPGLVKRWSHDPRANDGALVTDLVRVRDDAPYFPKVRGQTSL